MKRYLIVGKYHGEKFVVGDRKSMRKPERKLMDFDPVCIDPEMPVNRYWFCSLRALAVAYVADLQTLDGVSEVEIQELVFPAN